MSEPKPRVAIVCDWLTTMGGAEKVVLELHKMFPEAPIYTSSYAPKRMPLFDSANVKTSFIQKLPFSSKHQLWPVLRRFYFSRLNLENYDLVISSSGAEAKAVKVPNGVHINYCHSPTQYYWVRPDEYMSASTAGGVGILDPIWRMGLKILKPWMKRWDYLAAQNPDYIVANSSEVQKRIQKFYNRDSKIIFPPVDTTKFTGLKSTKREGFLIAGRQVHHKRFDLAVQACTDMNLPLRVVGDGPENQRLKSIAGPSVTFLGRIDDNALMTEYGSAAYYIFPQEDDFGIVAVEAMATGTPVIAYKAGGALDTVKAGNTGLFFNEQTVKSLGVALEESSRITWNHADIQKWASNFSTENFHTGMKSLFEKVI